MSELHDSIIDEISTRIISLSSRTERIKKDMALLSVEAIELYAFLTMVKKMPTYELSQSLNITPKELAALRRACKLTHHSPYINRSLLVRFNIIT